MSRPIIVKDGQLVSVSKLYVVQYQTKAGNWVGIMASSLLDDCIRYAADAASITTRVIERVDTVVHQ